MLAIATSVFFASLLGSLHCVGMCGPFVGLVGVGKSTPTWRPQLAYHVARLGAYLIVGAVAGTVGLAIDNGATLLGAQRVATLLAGVAMIIVGVVGVVRRVAFRKQPRVDSPVSLRGKQPRSFIARLLGRPVAAAARLSPTPRGAALGAVTAFMPCGWLYVFALAAAGTASPTAGAVTMFAFWGGTVPALAVVGVLARRLSPRLRARFPIVASVLVIAIGTYAVAFRAQITPAPAEQEAPCH